MRTVILIHSVIQKLSFRASNYLFHFVRKNHFQSKPHKLIFKPATRSKEKELLHQQLLSSLQKCKTVEEQIKVFYSLVQLPNESVNQRYAICKDLENILHPYFPSCSVHLIGSSANGLGIKGCDVDLSIKLPNESIHKSTTESTSLNEEGTDVKSPINKVFPVKKQLLTIRKILQESKYDEPLTVIPGRCPILNFTSRSLPCDLSVNNSIAFNSTNLMLLCAKLDERVAPLMQIVIYWAKKSSLVGGHSKFKTYAIFLMVVYFLQTRSPPVLPSVKTMFEKTEFEKNSENWSYDVKLHLNKFEKSKNNQTVEQLLKEFFLFYGNFDFSYIICPINGSSVDRKSLASVLDSVEKFVLNAICIQDPFNLEWNVTTGVYWNNCKNFQKAIISVLVKNQDKNFWIPGPHHWGLASLFNTKFSFGSLKDIKDFSIDLSFLTITVSNSTQSNSINFFQKFAKNLKYILEHCLLFQCHTFNKNTNLLELPSKVKTSVENLLFLNDPIPSIEDFASTISNCEKDHTYTVAQYICATKDTCFGRNTFNAFVNASGSIFDTEHEVSKNMIAERGTDEKEVFYFLCQCLCVSVNNTMHLQVRLNPLNSDKFIPKLAVFLKDYIPHLMEKFYQESLNKS